VILELSEQQLLLQETFAKLFARESTPLRVRAVQSTGFDAELWNRLVEMQAPLMRTPEEAGGGSMSLFDALVVAEQVGRHLASVPLIESLVTSRLLGLLGSSIAREWLERTASGKAIVTLALREAADEGRQMVPAGATANAIVVLDGGELGLRVLQQRLPPIPNLGGSAAAELVLTGPSAVGELHVIGKGPEAMRLFASAVEEWKLLTAGVVVAMTRQALDIAAAYSRERPAFDRLIGSYQGLAHPLADSITEVEGAQLLNWFATWSVATHGGREAAARVAMAYWWATQVARTATVRAMRIFGGYGMSLEYDAQLYFYRSRACSLIYGNPRDALLSVADRLWDDTIDAPVPDGGNVHIDFGHGDQADAFAREARKFFEEHLTPELSNLTYESGDGYDAKFQQQLAGAGLIYVDWPPEVGGRGRSVYEKSALYRVYGEYGWWVTVPNTNDMVAKMLMRFGSAEARNEILPRVLRGEANCSLGYSEPSCGSDIFAVKTRAVRDGGHWVINGQKMFTSQGHLAQYALLLTRTDTSVAKHAGLTLFIVPIESEPGYQCTEIKTIGGERTNVTFYNDIKIPDKYRVGEVNGGVKVMAAALLLEQSTGDFFLLHMKRLLEHGLQWARTARRKGRLAIEDEEVRLQLARTRVQVEVLDALTRRCLWAAAEDKNQKWFAPMAKLFGSEALVRCSADLMDLAAPGSLRVENSDLGWIELESRRAISTTIYAGTSEVQRSIIAESALNMPRTRS